MLKNKALIFVYNANSGPENSLIGSIHKVLSPKTYECRLCELTYGILTENRKWKSFRKHSDIEMIFLHKDEYQKQFKSKFEKLYSLPVVLYQDNYELGLIISREEINDIENVEELIDTIKARL